MDAQQLAELKKLGRLLDRYNQQKAQSWVFLCPNCRTPRRAPGKPRLQARHFAQIAMTSIILMLATWNWFEWKGVISFLPLWMGFEIVFRTRCRAVLLCSACGFDPYLYLSDLPRARAEIEAHWRRKFDEKGIPFPEKRQGSGLLKPPRTVRPRPF